MRLFYGTLVLLCSRAALAASLVVAADSYFEANRGQAGDDMAFVARGPGYTVLVDHGGGTVYRFSGGEWLRVEFPGHRPNVTGVGEEPLSAVTNYYRAGQQLAAIPHFQNIRFHGIYRGIDLIWRSRGAGLEYEFIAQPGADPSFIQVRFGGTHQTSLDAWGNLLLQAPSGSIQHRHPKAWQDIGGRRHSVEVALRIHGNTARFQLGPYDRRRPLRIDPVLTYTTYVGGGGYDAGYAIATDRMGGIYVAGTTGSIGFPALGSGVNGNTDAFVMKFNESGGLVYTTVLASNQNSSAQAIAADGSGNVYLAGTTEATNFPVTSGAWQTVFGGIADAFAAKLNAAGQVIYATYIGGSGQETGTGVAVDPSGNAYVTGYTSASFPTSTGAAQRLYAGGFSDAFLVKLNAAGSSAVYSTLLGGAESDTAEAVAVDTGGHACIAGYTNSTNLAVVSAIQAGPGGEGDALIACLSADGGAWTMVSYLGGSNIDQAFALAIDTGGNLYVAGTTYSVDFPVTPGVFQTINAGGYDAFVAKLSAGGGALVYATYLGGESSDAATTIAVGGVGDVWVGGYTTSTSFPLSGAWQSTEAGSFDGFLTHLSADASTLMTSSYLGGTDDDRVLGVVLDPSGLLFATGSTLSTNFPLTAGALQGAAPTGMNAFLVNVSPSTEMISGQITCGQTALSGVTMTLSGSQYGSALTNGSGYYSFTVPAGGPYFVTPSLSGYEFGPQSQSYANLSSNQTANFTATPGTSLTISGQVTVSGNAIQGVTITLGGSQAGTATTSAAGGFTFTVQSGGAYTLTPAMAGYTFNPVNTAINQPTTSQTANFAGQCGSLNPSSVDLDATGQAGPAITVTAAANCPWTASSGGFIGIAPGSTGTGNGTIGFTVAANSSNSSRTGTITAAGQTATVTQRATSEIFADVPPSAYYFDFANMMDQAGITGGCSIDPLDYCPNVSTTRGEMAVFLIAAIEGGNSFSYTTTPYFTDVPPSSPYFRFVQKLKDLGITEGCTATTYCPDNTVTRGEMAVFIIASRYDGTAYTYPPTPYFSDVPTSSAYFPFVQKMAQTGITGGCAPGLYCPDEALNRGQMAVFIVTGLLNELLPAGTPVIASAAPNSASPGQTVTVTLTGSGTHFAPGTTQLSFGSGITASQVTVLSETSLTAALTIGATVAANPTTIVAITGTEEADLPNGLLIQ